MSDKVPQLIEPVGDDRILSIIRASFGWGAGIVRCTPIDGGHFNTLYDIRTSNPDLHVVLRLAPRDNQFLSRYERTMMLAEPHIYGLMRQAGVPTVEVLAVDGSGSIIDRSYIIIRYIDAVPMSHSSVPAEARPGLMRELGMYTARMHGITGEKFGWIMPDGEIRGSENWADVFGELVVETYTRSWECGVISRADSDAALACFRDYRPVFDECREPVLVHNDIWDPNILVSEKDGIWQIEAIIDADRAVFADREFEFILWDSDDPDFRSGYDIPLDPSESAVTRRQFYRMWLYMQYAWFYGVMRPSPEFQSYSKKTSMDILQGFRQTTGKS